MRSATPETVRALRRAIGPTPYSRWAKDNGLLPVTVHSALNGRPMSAQRENTIRAALDMPLIRYETVQITDRQRIVTRTRPRPGHKRRSMWVDVDDVDWLDAEARRRGYRSVGEWALSALWREIEATRPPTRVTDITGDAASFLTVDYTVCNSGNLPPPDIELVAIGCTPTSGNS